MTEIYLNKKEKCFIKQIANNHILHTYELQKVCKLKDEERMLFESQFVGMGLIKKIEISCMGRKLEDGSTIIPYGLTLAGKNVARSIFWYTNKNFWIKFIIMIGTVFTAVFTGILAWDALVI